jgi:hypothetical protein
MQKKRTTQATEAARLRTLEDRLRTYNRVTEVIRDFCTCGECHKNGYKKLCQSYYSLCRTLETLQVPTVRGKVGKWRENQVRAVLQTPKKPEQSTGPLDDFFE